MDARRCEFTPKEREWLIDSVRASQWASGIYVSRYTVARLLDELAGTPLPRIGEVDDERADAWRLGSEQPLQ